MLYVSWYVNSVESLKNKQIQSGKFSKTYKNKTEIFKVSIEIYVWEKILDNVNIQTLLSFIALMYKSFLNKNFYCCFVFFDSL